MPRVKPAAGLPPYHHHRALPGPGPGHGQGPVPAMMHREVRDPYGPPVPMHLRPPGHGPGPLPYDMLPPLPPPEVLEHKLVAQRGEMQKLAVENDRLALSHASLRKELAAAQQELQRLQAQGEAAKAAEEQEMRSLLDKVAKMEADLKACENLKVELQQAHAEAQNLVAVRQSMMANAQKLSKDLQRNLGEAQQQLPALMAERDAARQEIQHLRNTYDYERKLRVDHSESLQTMKRNYDSMVTELEKLRAELRDTSNLDKSGFFYNNTTQKADGISSHLSSGQISYDSGYGSAQARTTPTGLADPLSGSPGGTGLRSGFDPSRSNAYDGSHVANFSSSKTGTHDASRAATGFDSLKGSGYDASKAHVIGQASATAIHGGLAGYYGSNQATPAPYAWGQSASTYGSVQVPPSYTSGSNTSYSATAVRPYGSAQAQPSYGQTQAPSAYGHTQLPSSSFSLGQAQSPFTAAQGSSPYGLAAQPPAYGSGRAGANAGNYEVPHGRK